MLNAMSIAAASPIERRDQLLAEARPGLEALARRLVWDREEARDVVQSSLLDALDKWNTLENPAAAEGWLRRIVVNRAYSHLRRRRFWNAVGAVFLVAEEQMSPGPDEVLERSEHQAAIGAAVARLPARMAMAFSLRYLEGWSFDDVASAMNIDRGTARIHVQRAVEKLRDAGVLS